MKSSFKRNFSFQKPRATQEEIQELVESLPSLKNLFPSVNLGQVIVKDTAGFTYSSRFNKEDIKLQQSKEKNHRAVELKIHLFIIF